MYESVKHVFGAKVNPIPMLNLKFLLVSAYPKFQKTNENIKIYDGNIRINHIDRDITYIYHTNKYKTYFIPKKLLFPGGWHVAQNHPYLLLL
jgi:hypothetical protein